MEAGPESNPKNPYRKLSDPPQHWRGGDKRVPEMRTLGSQRQVDPVSKKKVNNSLENDLRPAYTGRHTSWI